MHKQEIDARNAEFWNELCGSSLARSLGISEPSVENLRRFDEAYLAFYPYLAQYVLREELRGKKVLEIGLGYGTLGSFLASQGCGYWGIDIANGPLAMMRYRFSCLGQNSANQVQRGSALKLPYKSESFDYVYTIGCLHHTGNLNQAVSEVYRVLQPGGRAIVMLYHRYAFRRMVKVPIMRVRGILSASNREEVERRIRALYDTSERGEAAPHTDYVSRAEVMHLFNKFSLLRTEVQNFDSYRVFKGKITIPRAILLGNLGRILGLDLYITATK